MEQFVVPQFIDVEDKVIGPVTVRQFIILLCGAGVIFIAYKLSDFALFFVQFVIYSFIFFSFAFIKINGRPLHYLILNVLQTFRRPRLRVWHKDVRVAVHKDILTGTSSPTTLVDQRQINGSRLAQLSLIVDTGGAYRGEEVAVTLKKI